MSPSRTDLITAEIIRHRLLAITKQIEVNITRTAYSPLVYEYKDYAVGIVDHEGRLVAESGGGIPLFVADSLGVGVRDGLSVHGRENIKLGDVIVSNHAGTLGQHLNNVIMYTPVFTDSTLVAFMAIIVHWIDIGGWAVGSAAPVGTTDIYQEGIQLRSIKLWSEGKPVQDVYRIIESNSRFPAMLLGDIGSQLAGCLLGRTLIDDVIHRYGLDAVQDTFGVMWNRSEAAARAAIRTIPDGEYRASSFLDDDNYERGKPVSIAVSVRVDGDRMTIDLSGVADQVKGSINSGRFGGAVTAARIAFKYICAPHEPSNDGSYRPLEVVIPDGKFLSASGRAAMSMYSPPLPTVIDTIIRAIGEAIPERAAAGHHANFGAHVFEGRHPATGAPFLALAGANGGWGALHDQDGPGPYKTMSHGDTLDVPVEVFEQLYPLRVESYELRPDSGGAGAFRGGLGIEKRVTALSSVTMQLNFDRSKCQPWGLHGGNEAAPPAVTIYRRSKAPETVMKGTIPLEAGDSVHILSSGGGGFGRPSDRRRDAVARDVQLGYVSPEEAKRTYGYL